MKRHTRCLFLFALLPVFMAQTAPQTYVIPFVLSKHNNLCVRAVVNGKDPVLLMLHTASSSVTLTEEGARKAGTVHFTRTDTVSSWGGNGNTSRYSESNRVQIGRFFRENISVWENKNSGPGTDGKFGLDLFEGQTVEIDFARRRLHVSPGLPDKVKHYQKLRLITRGEHLFIEAACEIGQTAYVHRFLIHSGYSGGLLLDDAFVSENKLSEKLHITDTQELKDAYGGIVKVQKAVSPVFIIGNTRLTDVPVGFFEGTVGRQKMSVLGGEILKRFNWILDARREYVYLRMNKA